MEVRASRDQAGRAKQVNFIPSRAVTHLLRMSGEPWTRLSGKGGHMTEVDGLDRNIESLREMQRVAWQQLADRSIDPVELKNLRNQLKRTNSELRSHLEIKSQRAAALNEMVMWERSNLISQLRRVNPASMPHQN